MANITQTIPALTAGISQQPDEQKIPGQVRDMVNALPDVTQGLLKRPAGRFVGSLSDGGKNSSADGKWFHYYRDENEQYIGQVHKNGTVRMWDCLTGAEKNVTNAIGNSTYLTHTNDEDIQTLTLNDFTYLTNRSINTEMDTTEFSAPQFEKEVYVELKAVAYAKQYGLNLFDGTTTATETRTTATRISIPSSNLDDDSTCPNVGTEIFNVGTGNDVNKNIKQEFLFKAIHGHDAGGSNFFETDSSLTYKLHYCPPEWTTNTFYRIGDLVTGRPDTTNNNAHQSVYKLTTINNSYTGNSTGTTLPTATSGGTSTLGDHVWTHIADTTYTANANTFTGGVTSQTYHSKPCITLTDALQVANKATLDTLISEWKNTTNNPNYAHLPFVFDDQQLWNSSSDLTTTAEIGISWKDFGYYSDQIDRIILERPGGTGGGQTIGGSESDLVTSVGQIQVTTTGWDIANVLGDGRSDLYFRITNTGQAIPDSTGANYSCRYTTTVDLLHGGSGWQVGDKIRVELKGATHIIQVDKISTSEVRANLGLIRPTPTSFDTKTTVTADSILGDMRAAIVAQSGFNATDVEQIGSGLYIKKSTKFSASTPVKELLNVVASQVNDIGDLPSQCKHGMVVEVVNSNADEDNHYVQFHGNGGLDGEGVWEECAKPGRKIRFKYSKMPVALIRTADGAFRLTELDGSSYTISGTQYDAPLWEDAIVGDDVTNPEPSFINKPINKMLFFRNRLAILSEENIILSRPGKYFNFFASSAIQFIASDPIDISASSEFPATLYDGIQINSGLILFSKNQQFMLTTDSDVLSVQTAKINSIATYNFNYSTNPISLGTTIGFLDNAGKHTRFFEMASVLREGEPEVIEQSAVVSKLFNNDLRLISNSRENSVIFFSEEGTSTLYGYRYFDQINQRKLASWFKWELTGAIQYHCVQDDSLFVVVRNNSKDQLLKFSIVMDVNTQTVSVLHRVHLDHLMSTSGWTYNATTKKSTRPKSATSFTGLESTNQLAAYDVDAGDQLGRYAKVNINGSNYEIDGDWSSQTFLIGYLYTMQVDLPTIYYTTLSNERWRADTRSNTIIHRIKLGFGPVGLYETKLTRRGKEDYTEEHEPTPADAYSSNTAAIVDDIILKTIPVYDRNINTALTVKSTHPAPATLYHMTWEGVYNNNHYKSV